MLRQSRTRIMHSMINFCAGKVGFLTPPRTIASRVVPSANLRALCTMDTDYHPELRKISEEKRSLRTVIRRELKKMDPIRRSQEDVAIQRIVLEATWFKNSRSICAYISSNALREVDTSVIVAEILSSPTIEIKKKLYVPRMEDGNSNMRMLRISSGENLVVNSQNILEPTSADSYGNPREDVMQANDPVDLIILPGLAFDRSGRRLGRGGGYYDVFLEKYQDLVKNQNWKQPLLVALSYSIQITENERIPVTPSDVLLDALVSPSGFIPISPIAFSNCH